MARIQWIVWLRTGIGSHQRRSGSQNQDLSAEADVLAAAHGEGCAVEGTGNGVTGSLQRQPGRGNWSCRSRNWVRIGRIGCSGEDATSRTSGGFREKRGRVRAIRARTSCSSGGTWEGHRRISVSARQMRQGCHSARVAILTRPASSRPWLDVLVVRGRGRRDPRRPELSHCVYALRSQSVAMSEVSFVCRSDRRLAVESQYESLTS